MRKLKIFTAVTLMAALLLSACGGSGESAATAAETTAAQTEAETASEADIQTEPASETEAVMEQADAGDYHMLQGVVEDVSEDGDTFSLRCDDGITREISVYDIGDMEVNIEDGTQIAIAYIGDPLGDSADVASVKLVVAFPEQEEWTFRTISGVTTSNGMSAFGVETTDGENIEFLKDNCPIEDGALSNDDGDKVTVTYVQTMDTNYPIEIKAGEE